MKNIFSSSGKPKVLVCVLTGVERTNWIHPTLALNLLTMSQHPSFAVEIEMVCDKQPVDYARNFCVAKARERKADFLFMVDNDQCFEIDPLNILKAGLKKDVIGLPTMQGFSPAELDAGREPIYPNFRSMKPHEADGEFFTVSLIGTGAMFINRRVWEKIPGPWFKWCYQEDSELRETDKVFSEDFYFCDLARRNGFKVWAHNRLIQHWKTCEVARIGGHVETLRQMAAGQINGNSRPAKLEWGKGR
jgi:hypothetical protein